MLVCDRGGLRPPRVDDHKAAPAGLQRADAVADAGRGHQAAVRGHRVAAEAQEELRAIYVGDREQELVPEQLPRRQHVGQLVERGGRVAVARAQRREQRANHEHRAEVMDGRVAGVEAHRVATVVALDGEHPRGDVVERLVPPDALPSARAPPERKADPLGIDVDVLERVAFGTDMAAREVVVLVPAY